MHVISERRFRSDRRETWSYFPDYVYIFTMLSISIILWTKQNALRMGGEPVELYGERWYLRKSAIPSHLSEPVVRCHSVVARRALNVISVRSVRQLRLVLRVLLPWKVVLRYTPKVLLEHWWNIPCRLNFYEIIKMFSLINTFAVPFGLVEQCSCKRHRHLSGE